MNKISYLIIIILFIAWSSFFIFKSSFLVDGTRYFCLFDDAMISMRYAWNVSHGIGLVWNEGEKVEGFTNMLMTLYMSVWTFFLDKKYAVLAVQISGIFFMLVNAYFFMKIADKITPKYESNRALILKLAFVSPLTYYPLVYWTLMGMETGMLATLTAAAVYFFLDASDRFKPIVPILLGLAFLTRPDAAIIIAVIILFRIYRLLEAKKIFTIVAELVIVALFVLGVSLFRWSYYGNIFPNTYTLKATGMDLWFRILENGLGFVLPFLSSIEVTLFLCLSAVIFFINKSYLVSVCLFVCLWYLYVIKFILVAIHGHTGGKWHPTFLICI